MNDLLVRLQAVLGDRYQLKRELGGGGMSRVFAAEELGLERPVAIKVLPPEFGLAVNADRFRREVQVAASLQHPHIVPLLSAGEADGLLYYTMPLIDGETLRARLARERQLPIPEALRITGDVLEALSYAHRHGVVHRDIKPDNVLLVDDHALVTDFGIAKALTYATGENQLTSAGATLGTPAYMAPEQVAADPVVDPRSDIYATGVLAYEMLGGRPPFWGESPQRILAAHITDTPEPVEKLRPELAAVTASSVMRCLAKDPRDRWQTADDLRRELAREAKDGDAPALSAPGARRRVALVGVAVAGILLVAGWAALRLRGRAPDLGSPALVAVLPFSVRGSADVAYLGEGLVNLLSTSLDGAGNLRAVDPHAVLSVTERGPGAGLDPTAGARVADRLGAGWYVLGDVVEAGNRVRIGASLYARGREAAPRATASIEGERGEVFSLVDGLATQLLGQTSTGPTGRVTRVASVTTTSLAAYKTYLDGEAALRGGQADSALTAFGAAIALDTTFALAYYRLSVAAEWATRAPLAERSAEQAVRHGARLAEHDRLLLRALLTTRRGAGLEAEALYRGILGNYPDDVEAWIQLSEVLFHYGPTLGRPVQDSRAAFERVLYLDPAHVGSMLHLARIAALDHHPKTVDSLVQVIERLSPSSDRALEVKLLRASVLKDAAAWERLQPQVALAPDALLMLPVWDLGAYAHDLDGAAAVARAMADPARSVDAQAVGHATLAYLALAGGKYQAARAEIERARAVDPVRALEYGTLLELAPFVPARRSDLAAARDALERFDPRSARPSALPTVYFTAHDGMHAVLREYLLGVVNARLGDYAAAERSAAALAKDTGPPFAVDLPRDLGLEVRAEVALAQGNKARALDFLRQRGGQVWYEYHTASPIFSGAPARFRRAALDETQQLTLLSSFEDYSSYDLIYAAPARLARAALYERRGDRAAAARDYGRVVELWKDCDKEFRPAVDSARAALARLTASE